jgi:hypothetical protein
MAIEGHGRLFDVVPVAEAAGLSLKGSSGVTFIVTASAASESAAITIAETFGGSYSAPTGFAPVSRYYSNTTQNGTAAWTDVTPSSALASVPAVNGGTVSFFVDAASLPAGYEYIKVTGTDILVTAILHDLFQPEDPSRLLVPGE